MSEPTRQYLFSEKQVRSAFVLSGIGMVSVIVGLLLLASSRPQGRFVPADTSSFEATLAAAIEDLEGFEPIGTNRARIDIDTAMELVVERGVDLQLQAIGNDTVPGEGDTPPDGVGPLGQTDLPDGAAVFASCSGCHQAGGGGIPGAFPPLVGHTTDLYNASGDLPGRDYLVQVMLLGLQGEINVAGTSYSGVMPAWSQLSDGELASVLNYTLTSWGNDALVEEFIPYTANDVAAQRDADLGGVGLYDLRGSLSLP